MEKQDLALWQKIAYFNLDDPNSKLPFSQKLMNEQEWSLPQTQRIIAEYKKFMFLVMVEPKGASPSKFVDEVWHLHITFTQNYGEFCEKTIGRFIHHHPSKGGQAEVNRHADWYKDTLIAYIRHFDAPPPPDIWDYPSFFLPESYMSKTSQFAKPDIEIDYEDVPKWQGNFDKNTLIMTGASWLLLIICFGNPFLLRGPVFLIFYTLFAAIGLIFNFLDEQKLNESVLPDRKKRISKNLSPISLAWLINGDNRFFQTALLQAIESRILTFSGSDKWSYNRYTLISDIGNPLVATLQCIENKETQAQTTITTPLLQDIFRPSLALVKRQLAGVKNQLFEIKQLYGIWSVMILFGIIRVFQGIVMDKPILFLILLIVAVIIIKLQLSTLFESEIARFVRNEIEGKVQNEGKMNPVMNFAHSGQVPQNLEINSYLVFAAFTSLDMSMPKKNQEASSCGGSSCGSDGGDGGGCGGDSGGCGGCGGD